MYRPNTNHSGVKPIYTGANTLNTGFKTIYTGANTIH